MQSMDAAHSSRSTCARVAGEQEPDSTAAAPPTGGKSPSAARVASRPARRKFSGRPMRGARAAGDQREVGTAPRPAPQIARPRSHQRSRRRMPGGAARRRRCGSRRSLPHVGIGHQPDRCLRLPAQHAHEVGVRHRRQRMIAHRANPTAALADEQVAADRSSGRSPGKPGRRSRNRSPSSVQQRIGDRTDIAGVGRIESRAIFEIDLARAGLPQPAAGRERLRDRLGRRDGARLQGDDDRLRIRPARPGRRARRSAAWCACRCAPACWRDRWRP